MQYCVDYCLKYLNKFFCNLMLKNDTILQKIDWMKMADLARCPALRSVNACPLLCFCPLWLPSSLFVLWISKDLSSFFVLLLKASMLQPFEKLFKITRQPPFPIWLSPRRNKFGRNHFLQSQKVSTRSPSQFFCETESQVYNFPSIICRKDLLCADESEW